MLSWGNYWKENPKLFMKVMEKSTEFVAEKLELHQLINHSTHLFDFGCGPGYLANALKGKINSYYGVDISAKYIEIAKEKCKKNPEFFFKELPLEKSISAFTSIKQEGKQFDTIIILSVIQYFDKKEAVLELLNNCRTLLAPGGKILLVDVIENENGLWKDALSVMMDSIKKGYFVSFIQFMFRAKLSKYNSLRKTHQLFMLSKEEVFEIAEQSALKVSILPCITLQSSRISYCLSI
ncbi:MAG: class I SAM-dependent methyltransferase [Sphingobacteriia bacterium]|jgi:2-polyprenyl-3-methyl-5-hydroxy-6-metoxy-1,4-benzoquinol methylase